MKLKNILLIDDNEADNFVNQYLVVKSNISCSISKLNTSVLMKCVFSIFKDLRRQNSANKW